MYIDTHCHLQKEFYYDIEKVINENLRNQVQKIVVSGCSKQEIIEILQYALEYDSVFLTLGFHPDSCEVVNDQDLAWLKDLIIKNRKVVGIGEIGLDYHYGKDNRNLQIELFKKQLKIAEELNLPVVIHSRDAVKDTIEILKQYKIKRGIIHCFSGSLEVAQQYIKMGYYLGIGGVVTFKNSRLTDVLTKLSLENIVLETDSPYLTPEPFRGTINSSKYVPIIAKKLSEIYNVPVDKVGAVTFKNASNIFHI